MLSASAPSTPRTPLSCAVTLLVHPSSFGTCTSRVPSLWLNIYTSPHPLQSPNTTRQSRHWIQHRAHPSGTKSFFLRLQQVPTRWNTWNIISPEELPSPQHSCQPSPSSVDHLSNSHTIPTSPPPRLETHSQLVVDPDPPQGPSTFSLPFGPGRLGGNASPSENRAAAHEYGRQSLELPIHTWLDSITAPPSWPHIELAHTHTHTQNPAMTTTGYRCMMLPRRCIFWSGINRYCRLPLGRRLTLAPHPFPHLPPF